MITRPPSRSLVVLAFTLCTPIFALGPDDDTKEERARALFIESDRLLREGKFEEALDHGIELEKHTAASFPAGHWWRRDAASRVATVRQVLELSGADRGRYVEAVQVHARLRKLDGERRSAEALEQIETSRAIHTELLGEKHPDSVVLLGLAARYAGRARQTKQAIELGERAIRLGEEVFGGPHPFLVSVYEELSGIYTVIPRDADVERTCSRGLELAEALWGPDDGRLGAFAQRLAMSLTRLGRPTQALDSPSSPCESTKPRTEWTAFPPAGAS